MKLPYLPEYSGWVWSQLWRAGGVLLFLYAADAFLAATLNAYYFRVLVLCGISGLLALSLNLVNGCAGQFSLGHAGFMAIGAYASAALTTVYTAGPFWQSSTGVSAAVLLGGAAAAVAGYFVALPSLRLRGDYLAIVTLGFGEMIRVTLLNLDALGGARGLVGIPFEAGFFGVYAWVALAFVVLLRLVRSPAGRAILAVRDDEIAAQCMGVEAFWHKVLAFTVSSFFAGVAGGLFAHFQGFIDPQSFDFTRSVMIVIMVVMGGMGSFSGAFLGALLVTTLPEGLRVFESYRLVVFPLLLILLMLWRPQGLLGEKEIWELRGRPR